MKKYKIAIVAICVLLLVSTLFACNKANEVVSDVEKMLNEAVQDIQKEAKEIEDKFEVSGKAALEILHKDEKQLVYQFQAVEKDVELDTKKAEAKVTEYASAFETKLQELKDKGVKDAEVVVQFLDKEGKEIYAKVFK